MNGAEERLAWADASRFLAAVGIVLIHASADTSGQPFTAYPVGERVGGELEEVGQVEGGQRLPPMRQ